MGKKEYVWFGMKVTPEQKEKIKRLAKKKGTSQKEAVLHLVEDALQDDEPFVARKGSILEGLEHVVGSVEGPEDLSSNPKYMEGFGKD